LDARSLVIAALQSVDYVAVFEETTPLALIQAIRPDVLVKGADYRKDEVVGASFVETYGGRVHLAPLREGYSTTGIIKKSQAA
jgi:D-beta-D-heptose 7-phosphate kinase/D-beta-D-heptose 1-phosphate adenosyltransferase